LQRAIVDFAADDPFARLALKLREHYGFETCLREACFGRRR